jgi:acetyl esterase/lipase
VRVALAVILAILAAAPAGARTVTNGTDAGGPLVGDLFAPPGHGRIAVVAVHGGAWLHNDRAVFAPIAADLARRSGFVVLNVEYPRAPGGGSLYARQRSAVEQAVRWLRGHARSLGIDARRIGGLGGSAGGNLVALVGTGGTGSLRTGTRLGAVVAWSGQLDLEHLRGVNATNVKSYLGCDLAACPDTWALASPIDHVNHGDTPMLLFGSRHESTPYSQSTRMARALRAAGVDARAIVLPGSRHGQKYASTAMARTITFLRTHLSRG